MGTTEDEMAGWHQRLDGQVFERAPGVGDGQGGLACCSPWGQRQSDTTERLNANILFHEYNIIYLSITPLGNTCDVATIFSFPFLILPGICLFKRNFTGV